MAAAQGAVHLLTSLHLSSPRWLHNTRRSSDGGQLYLGCAACLGAQQQLTAHASEAPGAPSTFTCFAGFSETVVPIRHQGEPIGFLQTGQVRLTPPTPQEFEKISRQLTEWGATIERKELEEAYYAASPIEPKRYEGMIALLAHLRIIWNW